MHDGTYTDHIVRGSFSINPYQYQPVPASRGKVRCVAGFSPNEDSPNDSLKTYGVYLNSTTTHRTGNAIDSSEAVTFDSWVIPRRTVNTAGRSGGDIRHNDGNRRVQWFVFRYPDFVSEPPVGALHRISTRLDPFGRTTDPGRGASTPNPRARHSWEVVLFRRQN